MTAAVMGVVNVTPDSFVADVRTPDVRDAVERCHRLVGEGAAILDVGGESTRPGAEPVVVADELARVLPVIEAVAGTLAPGVRLSIDTRSDRVARAAVAAGATIVNDMSGKLGPVAAELGVGYVAGHMQGEPATMQHRPEYHDVVAQVLAGVTGPALEARRLGAAEVWIDPGIGFGKTVEHNLVLLAHLDRFVESGLPVLVGASRKAMVGHLHRMSDRGSVLSEGPPTPTEDRLEGSLAIATWAAALGAAVVRVHDVSDTVRALGIVAAQKAGQGSGSSGSGGEELGLGST